MVYLSHVNLANHRWCDYALLVLFVAVLQHIVVNGSLFVIITVLSYCLQSCSSDLYILSLAWFDTSPYSRRVQSLQSKGSYLKSWTIVCEDLRYLLKYGLWRQYPLVDKVILYMGIVQELHTPTTSSILDFGCTSFTSFSSLVHSINRQLSKSNDIAFTLHLR